MLPPKTVETRVAIAINADLENIESAIDSKIFEAKLASFNGARVSIEGYNTASIVLLPRIIEKYARAGWNIRIDETSKEIVVTF